MEKERSEKRFDGWREKREKPEDALGVCECCRKEGKVLQTEDGDFCEGCLSKMTWLR